MPAPKEIETTYQRFRIFQLMWVIFIIFHIIISSPYWSKFGSDFLNPSHPLLMVLNVLVLGLAVLSLFYPGKFHYFLLTILGLTVIKIDALPTVPNHIILMLIIHGTMLMGLLLNWDRSLPVKQRIAGWFRGIMPFLRLELLLLYFFVVLHKLNYDFFNPDVSCSAILYHEIGEVLPLMPQALWIDWANIVGTLLCELMIPIMLVYRRTRVAGIFLALVFHFLLSLHPELFILSFTAEIYALLVLFLPALLVRRIFRKINIYAQKFALRKWGVVAIFLVTGIVSTYAGLLTLSYDQVSVTQLKDDMLALFKWIPVIWFAWCLLLMGWAWQQFEGHWWQSDSRIQWQMGGLRKAPLWIFVFLVLLNGFAPYLGYKTATNFAMFSNLKVNGSETNHLFLPTHFQLSDLQEDTVTLHETNHPELQLFIENRERIPYFTLSNFLYNHRGTDITVRFSRDGKQHKISLAEDSPEKFMESTWLARKLLIFRGIPESGPTPCQW